MAGNGIEEEKERNSRSISVVGKKRNGRVGIFTLGAKEKSGFLFFPHDMGVS